MIMEMEDHDFQVVRKNLNILSVLILILAYTNAQLNSFNFLGIKLDLDAYKLYTALVVGYVYFVWRFLTKLNFNGGFWSDFLQYFLMSGEGVKQKHNFERYRKEFIEKSERLKYAIETNDRFFRYIQLNITRQAGWPLTRLNLSAGFCASGREGKDDQEQFYVDYEISLSRLFIFRKFILFSIKFDKFGDYLFPLIPVLVNVGFFFFKSEWQGSFQSLVLK